MQPPSQSRRVRFGPFEADLRTCELRKHDLRIKLQDQPFQVLALLLEQPGEMVSREELRKRLWPEDTFVDFDVGLNNAVKRLRDALGDTAETPRYVETLPRRGYRFVASVEDVTPVLAPGIVPRNGAGQVEVGSSAKPAEVAPAIAEAGLRPRSLWGIALAAAAGLALLLIWNMQSLHKRVQGMTIRPNIQSIAVLPLENVSGDPTQEYFADGLTEAVTTNLGRIGGMAGLRVISRTSTMYYKGGQKKTVREIARELNVDAVVEGAVLRSGNRVRITAQLIQAAPEKHLWAETYERDLGDILALEGDVARAIANEVQIRLSPRGQLQTAGRRQVHPEVYEAYLRGLHEGREWTEEGTKKSIYYLEQAAQKDPTYGDAWARLSLAYAYAGYFRWQPAEVANAKAKQAALRALEVDETLAEAHTTLAWLMHGEWDWAGARKELQRALALDPNYADAHQIYGYHLIIVGRLEEAVAEMKRALELDPLAGNKHNSLGAAFYLAARYDEAFDQFRQTPEPDVNSGQRHRRMAAIFEHKGMPREAETELLTVLRLTGRENLVALLERKYLGSGYPEAKKTFLQENLRAAKRNAKHGRLQAFEIASNYALLGEKDKAFEWLEKAFQERDPPLIFLKSADRFESLRDDPRFHDLLRRMGLPS